MPKDVPTRADYVAWRTATTRWRDDDAYGHLNNATYYELFDTAVNAHLYEATGLDVRALPQIGVVAETGCRYFREIGFPEPIEMGLVVDRVGTSSIVYRIGLFQGPFGRGGGRGPVRPRLRRQLPRRGGPAGDPRPRRHQGSRRPPAARPRMKVCVTVLTATRRRPSPVHGRHRRCGTVEGTRPAHLGGIPCSRSL
jgi:acyl-CoA thioester hydrolase